MSLILNHHSSSEQKVSKISVKQDKEPLNKPESASKMTNPKSQRLWRQSEFQRLTRRGCYISQDKWNDSGDALHV